MRPRITMAVVLSVMLTATAAAQRPKPADPVAAREAKIAELTAKMEPWLVEQRRDFHMHPELSNREERTARVVAERLRAIGYTEIQTGVGKYGVVALLRGGRPGPVVAVRADMDGLPIQEVNDVPYRSKNAGVKHACGHDLHTTVGLGVAEALFAMREQLPGTVKFIFQGAEEGPPLGEEGGAPLMIKEGVLENPRPQAIFALHTEPNFEAGTVTYRPGGAMASSDRFILTIKGKQSHGAQPHAGIDAIEVSAQVIQALQTIASRRIRPVDPFVLTVGTIQGGMRFNVVAPDVRMEGTVRTLDEKVRERALKLMDEIVAGVTKANGATYTLEWDTNFNFVTYNDPTLTEASLPALRRAVGDSNVMLVDPQTGAEDFSHFAREVPSFYFFLGVANRARGITALWHTPDFDIDEKALGVGVRAMTGVVVDYMERHSTPTKSGK